MGLRIGTSMLLATMALIGLGAPALAGGFAVTTFDQLPATLHADETYHLGYTIRQHGVTPLSGLATRIVAHNPTTGESAAFVGVAQGDPGHDVAEVRFPSHGVWQWRVEQGPFAPQPLGSVTVLDAQDSTSSVSPQLAGRGLLPVAAILAGALFAWRLAVLLRSVPAARRIRQHV
jgi:hypothetical protein